MRNNIPWYLTAVVLVMQIETCFAAGSVSACSDFSTLNDTVQIETKQMQSQQRYTLEMYNAIKPGMTYLQCAEILRSDGILQYEMDDAYTGKSESWMWMNDDRSYINLLFWNHRLHNKSQRGLR